MATAWAGGPPHLAPVSLDATARMEAEDFLSTPAFQDLDVEPAVAVKVTSALAGVATDCGPSHRDFVEQWPLSLATRPCPLASGHPRADHKRALKINCGMKCCDAWSSRQAPRGPSGTWCDCDCEPESRPPHTTLFRKESQPLAACPCRWSCFPIICPELSTTATGSKSGIGITFLKRFWKLWRVGFPTPWCRMVGTYLPVSTCQAATVTIPIPSSH